MGKQKGRWADRFKRSLLLGNNCYDLFGEWGGGTGAEAGRR